MNDQISIIVPIYNGEKYIVRCVNSITKQRYSNLQIILIDDGSKDNSLAIALQLKKNNPKIEVFHTDNSGVSHARNLGIEKASGQWIMFVDVDDYIHEDMIMTMKRIIDSYNLDTCCCNGNYINHNIVTKMNSLNISTNIYKKVDINCLMEGLYIPNKDQYYGDYFRATWGKIFSSKIIKNNNIMFQENIKIGEDALFLIDYFSFCDSVFLLNDALYYYENSNSSAIRSYKKNFFQYQKDEFLEMKKRFEKYGLDVDNASTLFWHKAEKDFIINELKKEQNLGKVILKTSQFCKNPIVKPSLVKYDGTGIKSRIRSLLIKTNQFFVVGIIDTLILKNKLG